MRRTVGAPVSGALGRYKRLHLVTYRAALEAVDLADAELGAHQDDRLQAGFLRRRPNQSPTVQRRPRDKRFGKTAAFIGKAAALSHTL